MADKNNILYLFDRPTEPIFIGKGDDNVSFDVPTDYLVSKTHIIFNSLLLLLLITGVCVSIGIQIKTNTPPKCFIYYYVY